MKQDKRISWMWASFFVLLLLAIGGGYVWTRSQEAKLPPSPFGHLPKLRGLDAFQFLTQANKTVSDQLVDGKIVVVNFIFTHCPGPCKMMTARMRGLQTAVRRPESVQFVSVSVDPEHDRPHVLYEYGRAFSADFANWSFLTGVHPKIVEFAQQTLKVTAGDDPSLHTTKFVLFDSMGTNRGFYDSDQDADMNRLMDDIRVLLASKSS